MSLIQGCFWHSDFEIFSVSLIQGCTSHSGFEIFSLPLSQGCVRDSVIPHQSPAS